MLHSDYCEMFDPFEVYFENLSNNHDETDYITMLADTVTHQTRPLENLFQKWFVAMVACVLDENKSIKQ